jgi:hypothetical protein
MEELSPMNSFRRSGPTEDGSWAAWLSRGAKASQPARSAKK